MSIEPTPVSPSSIPAPVLTFVELDAIRKMLVRQIDEATEIYDLDRGASELQLSEAALERIEELLLDAVKHYST